MTDCPVLNPSVRSLPYEQTRECEISSLIFQVPPCHLCHAMPCHVQDYQVEREVLIICALVLHDNPGKIIIQPIYRNCLHEI